MRMACQARDGNQGKFITCPQQAVNAPDYDASALEPYQRPKRAILSLCLIARDEEEDLPRCLQSVQGLVDEIILLDTGSQDSTPRIAQELGARVFSSPWAGNFSQARNEAISHATGDWILILDADEEIPGSSKDEIRKLLSNKAAEGYLFRVVNFLGCRPSINHEVTLSLRLFRKRPEYQYQGVIHEQIVSSIVAARSQSAIFMTDIEIYHYGYLNPSYEKKNKAARNLTLLRQALSQDPQNPYLLYNLGVSLYQQGAYEEARATLEAAIEGACPDLAYLPRAYKVLVLSLKALQQFENALKVADKAINLYRDYTDLYFLRGSILAELGDFRQAIADFEQCLALGPASPRYDGHAALGWYYAHYRLGRLYEELSEPQKALFHYQRTLEQEPEFPPALLGALRVLEQSDEGMTPLAWLYKARLFTLRGEANKAEDAYLLAAAHPKASPEIFLELAQFYLRQSETIRTGGNNERETSTLSLHDC